MNVVRLVIEQREMKVLWSWGDLQTEINCRFQKYMMEREGEKTDNNKPQISGINNEITLVRRLFRNAMFEIPQTMKGAITQTNDYESESETEVRDII